MRARVRCIGIPVRLTTVSLEQTPTCRRRYYILGQKRIQWKAFRVKEIVQTRGIEFPAETKARRRAFRCFRRNYSATRNKTMIMSAKDRNSVRMRYCKKENCR